MEKREKSWEWELWKFLFWLEVENVKQGSRTRSEQPKGGGTKKWCHMLTGSRQFLSERFNGFLNWPFNVHFALILFGKARDLKSVFLNFLVARLPHEIWMLSVRCSHTTFKRWKRGRGHLSMTVKWWTDPKFPQLPALLGEVSAAVAVVEALAAADSWHLHQSNSGMIFKPVITEAISWTLLHWTSNSFEVIQFSIKNPGASLEI